MSLTLTELACPYEPLVAVAPVNKCVGTRFSFEKNPYLFPVSVLDGISADSMRATMFESPPPAGVMGNGVSPSPWWLVHTKPRQEKQLAQELRSLQIAHFLPVTPHKALTRGRTRVTWAPLFPGYLFQRGGVESRLHVLKTNRVVAIHPVSDRLGLICQLRDLADLIEKNVPLRVEQRFPIGKKVRVNAGVLVDKCGIVVRHGGKSRLFIRVNELLGGVSVEIEHHLVEPY